MFEFMTLRELLAEKQITVKELSRRMGLPASTLYSAADKRLGNLKIDLLRSIFRALDITKEEIRERDAAYILTLMKEFQTSSADPVETYGLDEYLDSYVHNLGEFLYHNPDHKVLFDSSMEVKKEDVEFVRQMIDRINNSK